MSASFFGSRVSDLIDATQTCLFFAFLNLYRNLFLSARRSPDALTLESCDATQTLCDSFRSHRACSDCGISVANRFVKSKRKFRLRVDDCVRMAYRGGRVKLAPQRVVLPFADREEAGRLLAKALERYRGTNPLVLAIPRGAVPMARLIANALDGELDVVMVRKLGAPGQVRGGDTGRYRF
jgi:ribosomal protein L32